MRRGCSTFLRRACAKSFVWWLLTRDFKQSGINQGIKVWLCSISSCLILFCAMCGCSPHLPYKPFSSDVWYCDSVKISCSALFSLCGAGLQQLKSTSAGWWVFPFCWWLSSSISFLVLLKDKSSFITTNIFWLIFNAIMFCQKLIYLLN